MVQEYFKQSRIVEFLVAGSVEFEKLEKKLKEHLVKAKPDIPYLCHESKSKYCQQL